MCYTKQQYVSTYMYLSKCTSSTIMLLADVWHLHLEGTTMHTYTISIHACMYYVGTSVRTYTCTYVRMYVRIYCMYILYVYIVCIYVCMYLCDVFVCMRKTT